MVDTDACIVLTICRSSNPAAWEAVVISKKRIKPNYRRRVLRLPDLDHCKTAVLNSLGSPASRRVYEYAIDQIINWYCCPVKGDRIVKSVMPAVATQKQIPEDNPGCFRVDPARRDNLTVL